MRLYGTTINPKKLPAHVAIIMDGNGRWARRRGLDRARGHEQGYRTLKSVIEFNRQIGVPFISVYAFSTENWRRPRREVDFLMKLAGKLVEEYTPTLVKNDIRLAITGSRNRLSAGLLRRLDEAVAKTSRCGHYTLNIAFNYGGKQEILDAVGKMTRGRRNGPVSEAAFRKHLYHPEIPDVDLLIRTSGEYRISNFLLWQSAYAELWFTKKYWPDFTGRDFCKAIADYQKRQRRLGGI